MKKSASLAVFCTQQDILDWIDVLRITYTLGILVFDQNCVLHENCINKTPVEVPFHTPGMFLYSLDHPPKKLHRLDQINRGWGLLHICPGGFNQDVSPPALGLTHLDAEVSASGSWSAVPVLTWLKKHLQHQITFGVAGSGDSFNTHRVYHNIGYTRNALELHINHIQWRSSVYPVHRSLFQPLK